MFHKSIVYEQMSFYVKITFMVKILSFLLFYGILHGESTSGHYKFTIEEAPYKRLCSTKKILTVNGQFPGPTLYAHKGDTIYVKVHNKGNYNLTIHWHGVKQPRNPWSDGPEYITQCSIKPGGAFKYKLILSEEEGTIWWHAHSKWWRATVHGALIVYPKDGTNYPFPKPHAEIPIILGEWWKKDVEEVLRLMDKTGGDPNTSDAYTINGQPGDLYPCSSRETFRLMVDHGKTYLLRIVNAIMNEILFFGIANHQITVVGLDGSYNTPVTSNYIAISPGQTTDVLLHANQRPDHYYMAGRAYSSGTGVPFDNTTTTAILQYNGKYTKSSKPHFPYLPYYNDTTSFLAFISLLRSKIDPNHPIKVPKTITTRLISTVSINLFPCPNTNTLCEAANRSRFGASLTNISYQASSIDILQAYYKNLKGVFGDRFPSRPPLVFNYTADVLPLDLLIPKLGTEVKVLDYNSNVEIVFQGTNLVAGIDHPMHLHGFNFYVVGVGLGNFDIKKDPLRYNLVDPPLHNTACVPKNGWLAIRFTADNPGVWFMHCHLARHLSWGMEGVFIVKDGKTPESKMLPPPSYMPPC